MLKNNLSMYTRLVGFTGTVWREPVHTEHFSCPPPALSGLFNEVLSLSCAEWSRDGKGGENEKIHLCTEFNFGISNLSFMSQS